MAAGVGLHSNVVNISLIQHYLQARVPQNPSILRFSHNEAGLGIKKGLGEHGLAPGGGEALLLQLGDLGNVAAVHRHDVIFHSAVLPSAGLLRPLLYLKISS